MLVSIQDINFYAIKANTTTVFAFLLGCGFFMLKSPLSAFAKSVFDKVTEFRDVR